MSRPSPWTGRKAAFVAEESGSFDGRVGLQQRVLPSYRAPFFDRLARACPAGLEIFAGRPRPDEAILTGRQPTQPTLVPAHNQYWLAGPLGLCRQPGLRAWVERSRPDVLILEANPRYVDNWLAMRAARAGTAVIGWGLGAPAVDTVPFGMGRLLWRRFLRGFDGLIAYSTWGAAQYAQVGFPENRIWIAVNAVVDGPEVAYEREPAAGRPLRVLSVGRLQPRKRVDLLIEAVARLEAGCVLRIVGDGPARESWERLARQRLPQTEFTGALEGEALQASFRWADLFVLPGTGGLAVQQAMAHGLPVVVAEGDGTQSDLVQPENGWLVPTGDVAAMTKALREAASDPEALKRRGQASRRLVQERINIGAMVEVFVAAMRRVAGSA
jgi:glycosyltransferase involved in cell wall biosynthesis